MAGGRVFNRLWPGGASENGRSVNLPHPLMLPIVYIPKYLQADISALRKSLPMLIVGRFCLAVFQHGNMPSMWGNQSISARVPMSMRLLLVVTNAARDYVQRLGSIVNIHNLHAPRSIAR